MTPTQRKLARRLAATQPDGFVERHAVIVSIASNIAVVHLSGDTTSLPGMRVAVAGLSAGMTVIVRIKGSDAYVAARLL